MSKKNFFRQFVAYLFFKKNGRIPITVLISKLPTLLEINILLDLF